MSDSKTLTLDQRISRLAVRLSAERCISIARAREIARAALMRETTAPAKTGAPGLGTIKVSALGLSRALVARGIPTDRAPIVAAAIVRRMRASEPAAPPPPLPGELEAPHEEVAQRLAKKAGCSLDDARRHVLQQFPEAKLKATSTKASEPSDAPSLAPSEGPADPTNAPAGLDVSASDQPVSVTRLARQLAKQRGISLELAQQLADRQVRAQRDRGAK